jgi:hypothetical protein
VVSGFAQVALGAVAGIPYAIAIYVRDHLRRLARRRHDRGAPMAGGESAGPESEVGVSARTAGGGRGPLFVGR